MKILRKLSLILMSLIGISSITACSEKKIYIPDPKPYPVEVKCALPDVDCNKYKHTLDSQQEEMKACMDEMRKTMEVCK